MRAATYFTLPLVIALVLTGLFLCSTAFAGVVQLPQTGQTTCYDAAGTVISCAGTGQDGEVQAGVVWPDPRFTDNLDSTVTDNLTGLIWAQDASTPAVGACTAGVKTWQGALDYVACLNTENYLGYNDWILPNINELKSLVDTDRGGPALPVDHLFETVQNNYWSSSSSVGHAWIQLMGSGGTSVNFKTTSQYAWPLRRGQSTSTLTLPKTGLTIPYASGDDGNLQRGVASPDPRFTNNDDGTVTDNLTGLIWLADANCKDTVAGVAKGSEERLLWDNALTWSNGLGDGSCGLNDGSVAGDWRLPNALELASLTDYSQVEPSLSAGHPFTGVQLSRYWSSSSDSDDLRMAWFVDMAGGSFYLTYKASINYTWPVRGGQLPSNNMDLELRLESPLVGNTLDNVWRSVDLEGNAYDVHLVQPDDVLPIVNNSLSFADADTLRASYVTPSGQSARITETSTEANAIIKAQNEALIADMDWLSTVDRGIVGLDLSGRSVTDYQGNPYSTFHPAQFTADYVEDHIYRHDLITYRFGGIDSFSHRKDLYKDLIMTIIMPEAGEKLENQFMAEYGELIEESIGATAITSGAIETSLEGSKLVTEFAARAAYLRGASTSSQLASFTRISKFLKHLGRLSGVLEAANLLSMGMEDFTKGWIINAYALAICEERLETLKNLASYNQNLDSAFVDAIPLAEAEFEDISDGKLHAAMQQVEDHAVDYVTSLTTLAVLMTQYNYLAMPFTTSVFAWNKIYDSNNLLRSITLAATLERKLFDEVRFNSQNRETEYVLLLGEMRRYLAYYYYKTFADRLDGLSRGMDDLQQYLLNQRERTHFDYQQYSAPHFLVSPMAEWLFEKIGSPDQEVIGTVYLEAGQSKVLDFVVQNKGIDANTTYLSVSFPGTLEVTDPATSDATWMRYDINSLVYGINSGETPDLLTSELLYESQFQILTDETRHVPLTVTANTTGVHIVKYRLAANPAVAPPSDGNYSRFPVSSNVIDQQGWYAYATDERPDPEIILSDTSLDLVEGEIQTFTFTFQNNGGAAGTSFLDVSFSDGLEILSSPPGNVWDRYDPGSMIWGKYDTTAPTVVAVDTLYSAPLPNFSRGEIRTYSFTVRAKQDLIPSNEYIRVRASMLPAGATYSQEILVRTPTNGTPDQQGWYVNEISGSVPVNQIPVVNSVVPQPGSTILTVGDSLTFTTNISDPNGREVHYNWVYDGEVVSELSSFTLNAPVDGIGGHSLLLVADDGTEEIFLNWDISLVDVAPVFDVTPSAGSNGSITPDTVQTIAEGLTTSFEITPDSGFMIDSVNGCGGSLVGSTYTTGAITADCEVTASFVADADGDGISDVDELALGTDPLVANAFVPQTGQITCYDAAGAAIPCAGTGQDGDVQAGVAWPDPRFTDNLDGTVSDNLTGLIWAQDAATPAVGACTSWVKTWQGALDYVACLNAENYLGYNDWILPNVIELKSLVDAEQSSPSLSAGHPFTGVQSNGYWSSNTYADNPGDAWYVDMGPGKVGGNNKTINYFVWTVRGGYSTLTLALPKTGQTTCYDSVGAIIACAGTGQDGELRRGVTWPDPRFTNNGDGTVTDNLTGLTWLANANCFGSQNWATALSSANALANGACGLGDSSTAGDWRLPNARELASLVDYAKFSPALPVGQPFTGVQLNRYWSSSTLATFSNDAWVVYMYTGNEHNTSKAITYYAWPVRGELSPLSFDVTPSAGNNGSMSPDNVQTINEGQTTSFEVTPDAGFMIDSVSGCGGSLVGSTYTTAAITANCTVTASFVGLDTDGDGIPDVTDLDDDNDGTSDADELLLGTNPLVANAFVPQTGQTACYDAVGVVIPCAGTGQDGGKLAGVAWPDPRFTDNLDGTVSDNLTGLIWAQDASTPTSGSCTGGIQTWQGSLDYVDCLNSVSYLGYSDWILPNVVELKSLVDAEQFSPALTTGHPFTGAESEGYWSSSTNANITSFAWNVSMKDGYMTYDGKSSSHYAWPVRVGQSTSTLALPKTGQTTCYDSAGTIIECAGTGQDGELQRGVTWSDPRFTNNGDGTVTDNLTGLIWLANANCAATLGGVAKATTLTWANAITWSNALATGSCGLDDGSVAGDWRLPNHLELASILSQSYPALPAGHPFTGVRSGFAVTQSDYWSSTTNADYSSFAWVVDMHNGNVYDYRKTLNHYVWPVRGGQSTLTFVVSPSAGSNGSMSPATVQMINDGQTTSFEITPDAGFMIDSVSGCGGSLVGSTYTTGAILGDCTVAASFVTLTFDVTPTAGSNGSTSPDTVQTIAEGLTTSFEVAPNAGFMIDSVSGCGGSLVGSTYTTGAIIGDCTVTASFVELDTDGDGIPDATDIDNDNDGISDADELALGTDPLVANAFVPQTGQTTCYDAAGSVISCTGTGQDGDVQAGVAWPAQRFTDNLDGTVSDNLTGLIWAQDASTPSVGACTAGTKGWQGAFNYVTCLNSENYLGYNDWMLPNLNELRSLIDAEETSPALPQGHPFVFAGAQTDTYWSSTTYPTVAQLAWHVNVNNGVERGDYKTSNAESVWPLRGTPSNSIMAVAKTGQTTPYANGDDGSLQRGVVSPVSRFKNIGDGTITDNLTGLTWLADANCTDTVADVIKDTGSLTWLNALNWSNNLATGNCGLTDNSVAGDWRLPNARELASLSDYSTYPYALPVDLPFTSIQSNGYWSSTTSATNTNYALGALMCSTCAYSGIKTGSGYVLPVRGGQSTLTFDVSPSAGSNGSMTPATVQTIGKGLSTSFEITPDAGFMIDSVSGCGGSLVGSTYTTGAITADCEVTASFIADADGDGVPDTADEFPLDPTKWTSNSLSLYPSIIAADYQGKLAVAINGISSGSELFVEQLIDANQDGVLDAGDIPIRSFVITDGVASTNPNVPGDEDGATNGVVTTTLNYFNTLDRFHAAGEYLFKATTVTDTLEIPFTVDPVYLSQSISGTVTDGTNPVPGALLWVWDKWSNQVGYAITDKFGNYRFDLDEPGAYDIIPVAYGYSANLTPGMGAITVGSGQSLSGGNVTLIPGAYHLTGRIVSSENANIGVPGVDVVAFGNTVGLAMTDKDGYYDLFVPSGDYGVSAMAESDISPSYKGYVTQSELSVPVSVTQNLSADPYSVVPATVAVTGRVVDDQNNPLPGIQVISRMWSDQDPMEPESIAITDAQGVYTMYLTPADTWNFYVDDANVGQTMGYTSSILHSVSTNNGPMTNPDLVLFSNTAVVHGTVANSAQGPIQNAWVEAHDAWWDKAAGVSSAADGSYRIGLPAGSWFANIDFGDVDGCYEGINDTPFTLSFGQNLPADYAVASCQGSLSVDTVSLISDLTSPQLAGTAVTFTATASGGSGSYEYQFYVQDSTGAFTLVQDYSATNIWTWSTPAAPNAYTVWVLVRNAGSAAAYEAYHNIPFTFTSPPVPNAVAITTSQTSPQLSGTAVTFTATASGGSGSYEYQFFIQDKATGGFTLVQDYSATNVWTWSTPAAPNAYAVWALARNAGSVAPYEVYDTTSFVFSSPPVPNAVPITTSQPSPQLTGTAVTFTAAATGGSGSYEYQFYVQDSTGNFSLAQDYSSTNSWTWTTPAAPGTYTVWALARNAGSAAPYEVYDTTSFAFSSPPVPDTVAITTGLPSPQLTGTAVTFVATASGGSGSYEYQFYVQEPTTGGFTLVQDYSATNSWTWSTTAAPDTYLVRVLARNVGSAAAYEAYNDTSFVFISPPLPNAVAITTNQTSPQLTGTSVTFTATASGGSDSYEYQFYVQDSTGAFTLVQDYAATNSWSWTTPAAPGTYAVWALARNAGSVAPYEVYITTSFVFSSPPVPDTVQITTSLPTPQLTGTAVTFTATASGGSGSYEYQFYVQDSTGAFTLAQDYSTTNSWSWSTPAAPGTYVVWALARNAGSVAPYEVYDTTTFVFSSPPVPTAVPITTSLPSPQLTGTAVTFTATASGGSGSYEYQFYIQDATGAFTLAQDYSATNSWAWSTPAAPGTYTVWALARNANSVAPYEVYDTTSFVFSSPPVPDAIVITSSLPSPQSTGTSVSFTAAASGGSGSYEYQFYVQDSTGAFTLAQDYSATNSWTWSTPAAPGTYVVWTLARNAGSVAPYEVYDTTSFVCEAAPTVPQLLYNEAVSLMDGAKIISAVQTNHLVDIGTLLSNPSYGAAANGSFAVFERPLSFYTHGGNCDSDDLADDPWPNSVTLRFAISSSGEVFVGAIGADDDVMTLLASGGGAAYYHTNDALQIYNYVLDWDQRANYLSWVVGDLLVNELLIDNIASGGVADWHQFWAVGDFGLFNGFSKPIFQVYSGITHQQADYSWYNTSSTAYDQLLREAWSPAETRDANLTLQRNLVLNYAGVIASAVETFAGGDNRNNEEVFLDGVSTGHQYDCGSIMRLFTGVTPTSIQLNNYSTWSSTGSHYRGAFVADSVSVSSYSESANGLLNPTSSFDQNPAPVIYELAPGWSLKPVDGNAPVSLNNKSVFVVTEDGTDAFEMLSTEITNYQVIGRDTATSLLQESDGDIFHEVFLFTTMDSGFYVETPLFTSSQSIPLMNQTPVVGVFRVGNPPAGLGAVNNFAPMQAPEQDIAFNSEDGSDSFTLSSAGISNYLKLGSDTSSFISTESDGDVFQEILFFETANSGVYVETRKVNKGVDVPFENQVSVVGTFSLSN